MADLTPGPMNGPERVATALWHFERFLERHADHAWNVLPFGEVFCTRCEIVLFVAQRKPKTKKVT